MDSWNKHLSNVIALNIRGKNMEELLNYKSLSNRDMSASTTLINIERAEEIEKLYVKAFRMCKMLANSKDNDSKVNLAFLQDNISAGLRRVSDILAILKVKAQKWGFNDDVAPETQRDHSLMLADFNAVQDNPYMKMYAPKSSGNSVDVDVVRDEIKSSLKALMDVVDYMEAPTLIKIQKQLDKLVEY